MVTAPISQVEVRALQIRQSRFSLAFGMGRLCGPIRLFARAEWTELGFAADVAKADGSVALQVDAVVDLRWFDSGGE